MSVAAANVTLSQVNDNGNAIRINTANPTSYATCLSVGSNGDTTTVESNGATARSRQR